ncbi:transketolase [Rickettsiella endosymbiont of Miltochrista miniata]|uniref:transketolase n=1 Tax=Rickettsiella endosymbiont of Miltochrista miniata TaxID=3066239 RepID=UPI00313CE3A7
MDELIQRSKSIRKNILDMIYTARASHIASCFSVVDILNILYAKILDVDQKFPEKLDRDFLIMSKGHAAAALYSTLANYDFFPIQELADFCKNGGRLAGHITANVPGIELSTGALGHGLSVGCGIALASKKKVYIILSDGECDEGSIWEAALFAPHHYLNNLTVIIDYNKIQSFGLINEVLNLEPFANKWRSFNWEVLEVDGHDYVDLDRAFAYQSSLPKVIIAHTIKGKGVSFMENNLLWHYRSPDEAQYNQAQKELLL